MSEMKFGADYLAEGGRIGGHIIISDDKFIWKPVKFGYIGHVDPVEIPITDVKTYIKKGSTLYLKLAGIQDYIAFYTWKGDKIIDAIKAKNSEFRMLSSDEYSFGKSSNNAALITWGLSILALVLTFIILQSFDNEWLNQILFHNITYKGFINIAVTLTTFFVVGKITGYKF